MSDVSVTLATAIDIALAALVLEAIILVILPRFGVRALALSKAGPNLAAGAFILLSFRLGLGSVPYPWPLLPLAMALVAHLVDLRRRWPRRLNLSE